MRKRECVRTESRLKLKKQQHCNKTIKYENKNKKYIYTNLHIYSA